MASVLARLARLARAVAVRVAWVGVAVVLSAGSAGLVAGMDAPPDSPARAELTWVADEAARPGLVAAGDDLEALADSVARLGVLGRGALAALVARELDTLSATIADGSAVVEEIGTDTARVRDRLRNLPGFGEHAELRIGGPLRERYDLILESLSATDDLGRSWVRLTGGAVAATALTNHLADHDEFAVEAVKRGTRGAYAGALEELDKADAALARARALREQIANTSDVTVLDEWLARNGALDAALRKLYTQLRRSPNRVTDAVREAYAEVEKARDRLPPDTRGLVVIMADIARGGLNQAVIAIEQARGRLAAAVDAVRTAEAESEVAGTGPTPTPGP